MYRKSGLYTYDVGSAGDGWGWLGMAGDGWGCGWLGMAGDGWLGFWRIAGDDPDVEWKRFSLPIITVVTVSQ